MRKHYPAYFCLSWAKRARLRGTLLFMTLLAWTCFHQSAVAQELSALSLPQCYVPAPAPRIVVNGSSCAQYPEYGPVAYEEQAQPDIPIKTVRIMFHVIQKDDGTGNWQSPSQDGGTDETILRGLVYGLPFYPLGTNRSGRNIRGLNNIYAQLDERLTNTSPNLGAHPEGIPAQGKAADSRIRFQLEGIRYYKNTEFWDMSEGKPGCSVRNSYDCLPTLYDKFITSNTALTNEQKTHIIHLFFTENPGIASTRVDQYGNLTSHYGFGGGGSYPGISGYLRGTYWTLRNHPFWSENGIGNVDPQTAFHHCEYVLAHELGHCLGLWHTWEPGEDCTTAAFNYDPPATNGQGQTNNIMDAPYVPGFSLSQCQVGKMHYFLGHAGVAFLDQTLVPDYCQHNSAEDVTIAAGRAVVWSSAHNLRGNLYVEPGASLTVRCRVGFVGPQAKIVVRGGGQLILDQGTIGNYATSEARECSDDLLLWLGGDGTDGDNSGLISIRNGGGFTSERLNARLTDGATLHIGPVPVVLDGCRLTTQPGSFLCVEPGATFAYERKAQITIEPGTVLGLNPAIGLHATCQNDLCDVLGQTVVFAASTVRPRGVTPLCPGSSVTMSARYADAGSNGTVTWYRDNTQVSNDVEFTDSPTGTASVVYRATVDFNNGCPPVTWSFTQPIAPVPGLALQRNTVSLCVEGSGTAYSAGGNFNLNSIIATLRDPNATANQNTTYQWRDPAAPAVPVLSSEYLPLPSNPITVWNLNVAALGNRGVSTYPLQLCNTLNGATPACPTCATVTFTLQPGPAFTVPVPALVCAGKPVTLSANGPSGTTYTWTASGQLPLTGSSVTVSLDQTTTYTVVGEAGGCRATRQVTVNVQPATCLVCQPSPPVDMNANNTVNSIVAYTFAAGGTYRFTQNTTFTGSTFLVPEGATLLFDAEVVLTLRSGARLDLRGGVLTATCEYMWGGIVAEASSGGLVSKKPPTADYSIISHSRKGLTMQSDALNAQPTLSLSFVAFQHNGQGLQVEHRNPNGAPFAGDIDNCLFESNARLMRKPWDYQSAQVQYVSRHHLALTGDCANLMLSNSTLDGALVAIWAPGQSPFVAKHNIISNFYVAGLYSHDMLPATTVLTGNRFQYPDVANDILTGRGPQVSELYNDILNYEGPTAWLREGVCVGIYGRTVTTATGPNFTLQENHFMQPQPRTAYADRVPFLQYGVIVDGGVVQHNTFEGLQIGYLSRSTQHAGQVVDNLFSDCAYGVFFTNGQSAGTQGAGEALVSCNTFERLLNVPGTSVGIMRDFCQYQVPGNYCNQVNFSTEPVPGSPFLTRNILQKNKFVWPTSNTSDHFYHIFNSSTNGQIVYSTFDNPIASSIVVNDPALVRVDNSGITLTTSTPSVPGNDCFADNYTHYGLRGTAPQGAGNLTATTKGAFLAQNAPNPCSGRTSVSYRTPPGEGEAQLVIRTYFTGTVVLRQTVPAGAHTVDLKVETLPPGSYHYALEIGGKPVAHHNLLVQ